MTTTAFQLPCLKTGPMSATISWISNCYNTMGRITAVIAHCYYNYYFTHEELSNISSVHNILTGSRNKGSLQYYKTADEVLANYFPPMGKTAEALSVFSHSFVFFIHNTDRRQTQKYPLGKSLHLPKRELDARDECRNMISQSTGQDLYKFCEQIETTLTCLNTLLFQLFVDRFDYQRNLTLQH